MAVFKLGEVVHVQVFNIITHGTIRAISTKEYAGKRVTNVSYEVLFKAGNIQDIVSPTEEQLVHAQSLSIGKMERP